MKLTGPNPAFSQCQNGGNASSERQAYATPKASTASGRQIRRLTGPHCSTVMFKQSTRRDATAMTSAVYLVTRTSDAARDGTNDVRPALESSPGQASPPR